MKYCLNAITASIFLFFLSIVCFADTPNIDGFQCKIDDGASAYFCRGTVKGYPNKKNPQPVVIYVPINYNVKNKTQVILHLHGHLLYRDVDGNGKKRRETFEDVLKFNFGEMLAETGRNAVLVIPSSKGLNYTHNVFFKVASKFNQFMKNLETTLSSAKLLKDDKINDLVLTGHSGAYNALCSMIATKKQRKIIHELYLFDAAYGCAGGFAEFAKDKKFMSAYTITSKGNQYIWDTLKELNRNSKKSRAVGFVKNPNISNNDIKNYEVLILQSDEDHWKTLNKYFPRLLNIK